MSRYEDPYYEQKTKELATADFNTLVDKRLNNEPVVYHGDLYNGMSRQENYITTYTLEDLTNIAEQNASKTIMAFLQDAKQKAAHIAQYKGTDDNVRVAISIAKEHNKESNEQEPLNYREVIIDIAMSEEAARRDINTNMTSNDQLHESGSMTEELVIGSMKFLTVDGGWLDIHQMVDGVRKKNNPSLDDIATLNTLLDPSWKEVQMAQARGAAVVRALAERATSVSRA
jgi:hypothetical protein